MPLNITDPKRDVPSLNRWARGVEKNISDLQTDQRESKVSVAAVSTAVTGITGSILALPPKPTGTSGTTAGVTIDGNVYVEVTTNYTSPNPLGTFAGVFLVVTGYHGSGTPVKVGEDDFSSGAGVAQSFVTTLDRTGETITCYVVAKNANEQALVPWTSQPSFSVTLDGGVSAPGAPSSLAATATDLGVHLTWNNNTEGNMRAYNLYRFTSNTPASAVKIATIAWATNGVPAWFDKTAGYGTTYFYWVTAVNSAGLESAKSTGVTSTGAKLPFDGTIPVAAILSYRPLSNPLTATDAGANATINIAANTVRFAGKGDVSYNSGSLAGLSYSTLYYVYADDINLVGGAVSYQQTTTKETALVGSGRIYFGSILTPAAGAADTVGNNDGGAGAQSGSFDVSRPTVGGSGAAYDGDFSTADVATDSDTLLNPTQTTFTTFTPISHAINAISMTLKITSSVLKANGAGANTLGSVEYSTNGGSSWTTVFSVTGTTTRAKTTDAITLPAATNVSQIQVRMTASYSAGAHVTAVNTRIFETWLEVIS